MTDQIKPADENLLRMDAYYYGFDATGVESVDIILSAIAACEQEEAEGKTEKCLLEEHVKGCSFCA